MIIILLLLKDKADSFIDNAMKASERVQKASFYVYKLYP